MSHKNAQTILALGEAWRAQDIPAMVALFTKDCVYEDMAMGAVNEGHAGLENFATEVFGTMPDFDVRFLDPFATDDAGASSWVIKATWNGEFEGVDVSGQSVEFTGLSMYEFVDGKISRARDCWDYVVHIKNFGVLPEALKALAESGASKPAGN